MSTLEDLYHGQIKDLYDAEHRILEALPKMEKEATSQELKDAINNHYAETEKQVERLERIFENHGMEPKREACKAMKGLIEEGESELKEWKGDDYVKDAAIIAAAQRVEHYEISGYGSAKTFAQMLGFQEDIRLLDETLEEEKNADTLLTDVALSGVNQDAIAGEHYNSRKQDSSREVRH
jgi:ferritin-like metal-binding protein YciE